MVNCPVPVLKISPCQSIDDTPKNAKFDDMSASKPKSDLFRPVTVQSSATVLNLHPTDFRIRKSGIEFKCERGGAPGGGGRDGRLIFLPQHKHLSGARG